MSYSESSATLNIAHSLTHSLIDIGILRFYSHVTLVAYINKYVTPIRQQTDHAACHLGAYPAVRHCTSIVMNIDKRYCIDWAGWWQCTDSTQCNISHVGSVAVLLCPEALAGHVKHNILQVNTQKTETARD